MKFIRKLLIAVAIVVMPVALGSSLASASAEPAPNVVDGASGTLIVVSAWYVSLITAAVIPFVTGLLTRWNTRSDVKTAITIAFNLAASIFATGVLEDGTAILSGQMVQTFVLNVLVSFAAYEWGWKKARLTSSAVAYPDPNVPGKITMVPGKLAFVGVK